MIKSLRWIIVGGAMLVIGWIIIVAAVVGLIPQILWLGFVSYAITLIGFTVGIVGVIMHARNARK